MSSLGVIDFSLKYHVHPTPTFAITFIGSYNAPMFTPIFPVSDLNVSVCLLLFFKDRFSFSSCGLFHMLTTLCEK